MSQTFGNAALEPFVELLYSNKLFCIPLAAVGESHRLHVLAFEHEAQRAVLIHREHMIEVIRVKLDLPAHMCILSKFGVETVIVALDSADCRAQSRPLDSIAETRCRIQK